MEEIYVLMYTGMDELPICLGAFYTFADANKFMKDDINTQIHDLKEMGLELKNIEIGDGAAYIESVLVNYYWVIQRSNLNK